MKLHVISTGSKGNCYALSAGGETLLLDAGVSLKEIITAVDMRSVVGCVVTHEHQDHCKAVKELDRIGIEIIASEGTVERIWGEHGSLRGLNGLLERQSRRVGDFSVMGFRVQHDAAEPFGFIVRNEKSGEVLLYATDTYYLRYRFPKINYWVIECNYVSEIMNEGFEAGKVSSGLRDRLITSHMSLDRLLDALEANDLSCVRKIVLVHLSDSRSDEALMISKIEGRTGIETIAADDGMDIDLMLAPF